MTREELNKKYGEIIGKISELDNENFNIFKVLGLTDYEIRHSNFLVWLLKNDAFFKDFIKKYNKACKDGGIKTINLSEIKREIKREESFYEADENKQDKANKNGRRYIDLNIIGKDFTITIENKIDSEEHDSQCVAYRNYVIEKYKEKKDHYFVFLAKKKPEDFSSDKNGKYPEYVFIGYPIIKNILIDSKTKDVKEEFKFDDIQKAIVKHYTSVIEEWETIPDNYVGELEKIKDLSAFSDNEPVKGLNQAEKRFVELARSYYKQKKAEIDEIIRPAVVLASKDSDFIKTDYGRGNYAVAIPLSFEVFSDDNERYEYLKKKKKLDSNEINLIEEFRKEEEKHKEDKKGINKIIKKFEKNNLIPSSYKNFNEKYKYLKDKELLKPNEIKLIDKYLAKNKYLDIKEKKIRNLIKIKTDEIAKRKGCLDKNTCVFQTVDYRAQMEGYNNPTIGIFAGLSKNYSKKLCKKLVDDNFINKLNELKDWTIELKFYFKNGAGFNKDSKPVTCDFDMFKKMSSIGREKILGQDIHGKKSKKDVTSTKFKEYLKLLENSNLFDNKQFSGWKDELDDYFTNKEDKEAGNFVFFGWNLRVLYKIENFEEQYKAHNDKDKEKYKAKLAKLFIEKTKEGVKAFSDSEVQYDAWFEKEVFEDL